MDPVGDPAGVMHASITTKIAAVVSTAAIFFCAPALAQGGDPRPIGVTSVGPWEIVVWGTGKRVQRCTLIRARDARDASYGFLVDQRGLIMSIESQDWTLAAGKPAPTTITLPKGKPRTVRAEPVSPTRANIDLAANDPLLSELQTAESASVKIGVKIVKLPFDDFNAARVTLEICVQSIGKDWRGN
jgi:hypothetical protein